MQFGAPLHPLQDGQLLCPQLRPEVGGAEHRAEAATYQ